MAFLSSRRGRRGVKGAARGGASRRIIKTPFTLSWLVEPYRRVVGSQVLRYGLRPTQHERREGNPYPSRLRVKFLNLPPHNNLPPLRETLPNPSAQNSPTSKRSQFRPTPLRVPAPPRDSCANPFAPSAPLREPCHSTTFETTDLPTPNQNHKADKTRSACRIDAQHQPRGLPPTLVPAHPTSPQYLVCDLPKTRA